MMKWLAFALTLVATLWLAFVTAQPPAPLPATAPANAFSADRAMADVRAVARVPHSTGSPENAATIAYLVKRLEALGFTVRTSSSPLPQKGRDRLKDWGSPHYQDTQLTNIIALRPGRDPAAPAVMMMAHHDSVWASPGAADDGAGVAAALEIARAIPRETQARDLVILLTDAEELGLYGAKAFFGGDKDAPSLGDPLAARIGAIVNMETRGGGGRANMFETSHDAGALIDLYKASVTQPATTSMAVKLYQLMPNSTDLTPALARGIPAYNLAFIGDAWQYHSPLATPENLDKGALQHIGSQALDLTRALVTVPELPALAPDKVFGDILGLFTIVWPPWFGWLLLAAATALIVIAGRGSVRDWRWQGLLGGIVDGLGYTAVVAGLLRAGNLLSGPGGDEYGYDRLAALPRLETLVLLLALAGLAIVAALLPRRRTLWDGWLGLAVLNLAVALVAQALLPAAGAIFILPLLLATLVMAVTSRLPALAVPLGALAAVPALAWLGGLAHVILLGLGSDLPEVAVVFAPLTLLLLWPVLPRLTRRSATIIALMLIALAGGIALWVRLDPLAASIPPYSPRN